MRDVDDEAFFKAVNRSYPSLIRVEADEVTYNMHVLLRFELENELLEGTLKVKDLPEAWNARVKSYLGINVPNDREGVLQDIHWSSVSFGVFPGYTLGNLIGAQLMEKIRADIQDLDGQIESGEFARCSAGCARTCTARPQVHTQRAARARHGQAADGRAVDRLRAAEVRRPVRNRAGPNLAPEIDRRQDFAVDLELEDVRPPVVPRHVERALRG